MQQNSRRGRRDESQSRDDNAPISTTRDDSLGHDADSIAQRAYHRYEERGREDGHDLEDWLSAEQELGGRSTS